MMDVAKGAPRDEKANAIYHPGLTSPVADIARIVHVLDFRVVCDILSAVDGLVLADFPLS